MRKTLSVLFLSVIAVIFSSCLMVDLKFGSHYGSNVYMYNDTSNQIQNWYIQSYQGNVYSPTNANTSVASGDNAVLENVTSGYYRVIVEFSNSNTYTSAYSYITKDTNYHITSSSTSGYFEERIALSENKTAESALKLIDSDGKETELELL